MIKVLSVLQCHPISFQHLFQSSRFLEAIIKVEPRLESEMEGQRVCISALRKSKRIDRMGTVLGDAESPQDQCRVNQHRAK